MNSLPAVDALTLPLAVAAGLLGSGHCLGMCGGIAALPALGGSAVRVALFNLGRLAGYALIGGIAGALGAGVGWSLAGSEAGLWLRAGAGVLIVLVGLFLVLGDARWLPAERLGARLWARLGPAARRLMQQPSAARLMLLGVLWGWLPCGLVYTIALAAAVSGGAFAGAATMVCFGLGTLPAMGAVGLAGRRLSGWLSGPAWRRTVGIVLLAAGIWTLAVPVWQLDSPGAAPHHAASSAAVS